MSIEQVLAPVITLADDESALMAAAEIAAKCGARATALTVSVHLASSFAHQEPPLSQVLADIAAGSHAVAAVERAKIKAWLARQPFDFEVRHTTIEGAVVADEILAHARVADLVVMARAAAHDRARRALLDRILFKSGRPLLLVPATPLRQRTWERVLVAWNATAEAVHAVAASLPLLRLARDVAVATVDASPSPAGHGQAPGRDLAAYLAGHGVPVTLRNVDGLGRSTARALVDEAMAVGADMLVLGAFGHSRTQEFFLGGVTRELLDDSPIPLLLAH
jgi:nucleotide-binding universal stress UspA family protein